MNNAYLVIVNSPSLTASGSPHPLPSERLLFFLPLFSPLILTLTFSFLPIAYLFPLSPFWLLKFTRNTPSFYYLIVVLFSLAFSALYVLTDDPCRETRRHGLLLLLLLLSRRDTLDLRFSPQQNHFNTSSSIRFDHSLLRIPCLVSRIVVAVVVFPAQFPIPPQLDHPQAQREASSNSSTINKINKEQQDGEHSRNAVVLYSLDLVAYLLPCTGRHGRAHQ